VLGWLQALARVEGKVVDVMDLGDVVDMVGVADVVSTVQGYHHPDHRHQEACRCHYPVFQYSHHKKVHC